MRRRDFSSLGEQEVLALAVSLEEEVRRTYDDFAAALRADYPDTAKVPEDRRRISPSPPK